MYITAVFKKEDSKIPTYREAAFLRIPDIHSASFYGYLKVWPDKLENPWEKAGFVHCNYIPNMW